MTSKLFGKTICLLAILAIASRSVVGNAQDAKQNGTTQTADAAQEKNPEVDPQLARLEKLEKSLSGAALVGRFTDSSKADGLPTPERYELAAVKHLGNNQWLFKARIRYGKHDVTVPLTLPILWAGDTPVITVDKAPVVGLGQFDARVMIYRDHYAGFWSGGDHGGHLFGKVVREAKADEAPPAKQEPQASLSD